MTTSIHTTNIQHHPLPPNTVIVRQRQLQPFVPPHQYRTPTPRTTKDTIPDHQLRRRRQRLEEHLLDSSRVRNIELHDTIIGQGRPRAWDAVGSRSVADDIGSAEDDGIAGIGVHHDGQGVPAFAHSGADAVGLGREAGRDGVCAVQTVKLWWCGGDVHDELEEEAEEEEDLVHNSTEQLL